MDLGLKGLRVIITGVARASADAALNYLPMKEITSQSARGTPLKLMRPSQC